MSKKQIDSFRAESPEQAIELFCAYVVTYANRLYADTTPTGGEPIEATKAQLLESLITLELDNRFVISLGRCAAKTGLYRDTVIEVVSALTGLGAALSGAILAIKRIDDPRAINEAYDTAVGQAQEYRKRLTELGAALCERMFAGLATRPPLGKTAEKLLDILRPLPETQGLTGEELADALARLPGEEAEILDASTIRKRHLPQLEPYGLTKTPHGYCIR